MVYAISYDLHKAKEEYEELYEKIKSLGSYVHPLESTWFVDSDSSSHDIKNDLRSIMDDEDLIFISEITSNYSGWLPKSVWPWLSERINR